MLRAVRLVEAYVPGLRDMPEARYREVAQTLLKALGGADGHDLVVVLPDDEVLLVLTNHDNDGSDVTGSAVVQRVVDAHVLFPYDDPES